MTAKDYDHLLHLIEDYLLRIDGAEKTPDRTYQYAVPTPLGMLDLAMDRSQDRRVWVQCRFRTPRLAIERLGYDQVNLTSGKWNVHFGPRDKVDWVFRMLVKRIERLFDFQAIHISARYAQHDARYERG